MGWMVEGWGKHNTMEYVPQGLGPPEWPVDPWINPPIERGHLPTVPDRMWFCIVRIPPEGRYGRWWAWSVSYKLHCSRMVMDWES
jgi:hypothetical protein